MRRIRNSVKAIIISLCLVVIFAGTILGVVLVNKNKNNDPAGGGIGGVEEIIYKLTEEQESLINSIHNSRNEVESLKETDWSKIVDETGMSVPVDKVVGIYENYFIAKDANDNEMIYFFDDVSQNNSTVTLIQALKANGCDVEDDTHIKIQEIAGNYVYYTAHYSKNGSTYESDQIAFIESIENAKIVNRFDLTVVSENKYYGEYLFDYLDIELIGEHYVYKLEYVDNDVDMVEFGICLYTEDFISADEQIKIVTTYENFRRSASSDNFITVTQQSLDEEFYYIKNNQIKTFEFVEEEGKVYSYTPVDNGLIIEIGTRVEQSENAIYVPEGNGGYYLKYEYKYFDVFSESVKEFKLTDGYSKASITAKSENNYFVVFEQKIKNNNLINNGLLSYYNLSFEKILAYETEKSNPEIYFTQDGYIATNEGILITEENTIGRFILKFNSEDFEYSFKDVSGKYFSVGIYGNYRVVSTKGRFVFDDNTFEALNPLGDGYFSARDDGKFYSLNANNSHIEEITNVNDNDYTIDLFDKFGLYFIKSGDESYSLYSIKNKDFYINNIISFVYKDNYSLFSLKLSTDSGLKYLVVTKNNLQLVNYESEVISYNYLDRMSEFSDVENYANNTWYDNPSSSTSDYIYYHLGSGKNDGNDYVEVVTPGGYYPTEFVACFDDGIGENGVLKCSFSISGGNLTITYDIIEDVGRDEGKCTIYNSFTGDASAGKSYVTFTRKYKSDGSRADFHDNHATGSNYGSNYSNYVDSERLWFGVDYYILSTSTYYDKYIDGDDYTYWDDYKYYWDQYATDGENDTYGSSHFSDIIGASPYGFTTHYTGKQSGNITQDTRTYGWGDIIGESEDEYKKLAFGNTTNLTNLNHWYKCYVTYKPYSYTVYTDNTTCDVTAANPTSCVSDQAITLQEPKKAGYSFTGWTATVSSGSIKNKTLTKTSGRFICDTDGVTITLTPNWQVNHYTLILNFGYNGSDNAIVINEKSFYTGETLNRVLSNIDDISDARTTILKTSNFYGKFDNGSKSYTSNTSTYSTQSVTLSDDSLRFNCEEFSTFGDLYGTVGGKFSCLRPLENNYAVYSYGVQYNIVGWAIHIYDDKKVEYITNSTSVTIIDYLKKSSTSNAEYKDAYITLYAIFEPKPYSVGVANDVNFGFGSLENKSADEDLVSPHKDKSISYKYQITGSDETKTMSTASRTVFEASNEILFEITINNGTDGDFYIFDRIEILNVGYYTGSDYKYANVILTYNNAWNLWVQKNDNQLARPVNGIYMSGNTQGLYDNISGTVTMHTYSSGTYKDYSFVDSSQVGINGFKIDTGSNATVLYLRVKNVGYAGNEKDQNDSSSRGCFDYKINNDSVTGRGQYGFTIKSFVKSNYKSSDDVVTNWDYGSTDVNDAANESFVSNNDGEGNALLTTPNYLTMSHIIPIKTANLVYQSNGAVGSVYYVWINGVKYTLRNSANNGFMTTEDSVDDLKGYYELKSDRYLRYSNDDSKQVFFYEKLTGGATQHYISYYAVKCTGNVTLSNAKYIYFDCSSSSKNVYYLGAYKLNATTNNYNSVNYNNTQFLAIAPQQTKIKFSTKPNAAAYSDDLKIRYELDYYLSAIKFGSAEYTLHAGDLLKHYHTDGKYDKFETLNSDLEAIESVANEYITYLGEKYETKYAYKILVGTRTYILYFTIRVDSSGNYKDNYVMYFLMSTVGNIENKAITLTYKKLQYNISVNVTDFEGANGFNAQPNNATVNYYDTSVAIANEFTPESEYDYTLLKQSYGTLMYPSEVRVIKISPKDGYLLSKVSLKLRDEVIMDFSLFNIGLGEITIDDKTFFSYTYSEPGDGGTVNRYYAKYLADNNLYFAVDQLGTPPNIAYTGIHFSETVGTGWNTNKTTNVYDKNTPAFESIYFLISGIYGDVTIDIETISFIEFDFENHNYGSNENLLGLDPFPRYSDSGLNYLRSEKGKYFIKFKKFDDALSLTYYAKFDSNVANSTKGDDNKYYVAYQSGSTADYYYVKEAPNDPNCKKFILVYSQSGSNYLASYGGRYIIDEKSTEISELYPYLSNDESTGTSQVDYLLSDVKNLTILVNDGNTEGVTEYRIGSQNILDCENDSDLLEASLVKPYGNTLRVMFLGKSSYFKNGVKIFASGNDYSAYFTNGYAYNDDSNDIRPSTESPVSTVVDGGHTIFEMVSEAEGRTNDNKELNIDYVAGTNNLVFNDKLTYIQIDDINEFFKFTIYNRNGEGFEFARKYFLKVKTVENNVTLNVNSYISNSSDKLATGTVTNVADTTNYGKSYFDAYSTTYTTGGVSGDHKVGNVLSNNTVIIKSDSRNTLADFVLTASNEINGDIAYSPFMWLDGQFYQLDYVDDATSKYKKQQSWFNDTVLTNIKYDYFKNRDNSENGQATTGNWQQQNVNEGMNKSAPVLNSSPVVYQKTPNPLISGYQIEYEYRVVPGYYLEYIVVETLDYGLFYIPLKDLIFSGGSKNCLGQIKYKNNTIDTKIHYSVEYVNVLDSEDKPSYDSKYIIKFYDTQENDYHNMNGLNSLGILSNNISINFFSKAYSIDINYKTNAENPNDETNHSYISSTPSVDITKQPLIYDTMETLDAIATMEGYSFIGWGSKTYDDSHDRFDKVNLTWNSSSRWLPVKVGQNAAASVNYFSYKDTSREALYNLGNSAYELYIKSSHADRKDTTGYFITDTGFAYSTTDQENYNFWSAYASIFKSSMKLRYPIGGENGGEIKEFNGSYIGVKFSIDLYAVWKANVYAVELNFNDATKKDVNDNTKNNGSTYANLALGRPTLYDSYIWNEGKNAGNTLLYRYNIGNLGFANRINQNVSNFSVVDNTTTANDELTDDYYCYVTYDRNDWYVISAKNNKDLNTAEYSIGSYAATHTKPFVNDVGGNNQLDFVIDRYGYSWLGWFSEKLANTYENKFTDSNEIVFGSDYYYTKRELDNHIRAMPYLRGWVDTEDHGEVFVSIDEFETFTNGDETSDKQTSVYSEIVYRGEKYFKEYGNYYVYHYDYRTKDESGVYVNNDFINGTASYRNYLTASEDANDKSIFAYYDTSLTLDSYAVVKDNTGAPILDENGKAVLNVADGKVSIERKRAETGGDDANYRYITLYAYWLVNDYNVIIDYRDKEDNADADCDSIYEIGSTVVTNKAEIESDYEINDIDGSGDKYNIRNTYFDDNGYAYVLNTAIPNRVGYDFVGWSFFFRDPQIPTKDEVSNGFSNGQLNKYNGLQVANNNYVLSLSTVSTRYYHTAINGETDAIYADVIALYNERESVDNRSGENYKYSYYLSQLYNNKYAQLHKYNDAAGLKDWERYNNEAFGDHEADGDRFIYIFAMWRAQTFTIDVNLNIDTEDLINGYDQDSAYSVGFYDSYNAAGNVEENEKGFVGINSLFVRQKPNEDNIVNYGDVFAEIVSNLTFIIYFDEPFSSAVFTDPNAAELKYYYLADLFAVSTGYYLINWLYDSDDPSSVLISNTLRTEYGYYSNLVNKNDVGSRTTKAALESTIFDYEYYKLLYNTNYKNMTDVDITEDNGLPISGKKFEVDNTNKLADSETNSNSITDGNNASFASTNFGYIVIDGTKCYIQPEFVDAAGDGITDSYHLYYKYDGVKYYVVFFDESENGPALTNDLTYMYYKPKDSAKKYVVRFDSAGAPYYVANTTYKDIKYFSLKVAIFNDKTFNESVASIEDKKTCVRDGASNGYDKYEAMGSPTFVPQITRQFTVYAHWEIKDDFYVSYTNGNSGQDEIIEGEPTGNVYKSNISNQGLAGFYASYLNGSSTPILKTDNKVSAGGNSYLMGYDIDTIRHNYKTYDDFGFDVIPFLNGRFISEVAIEFDRLEAVATSNVTTAHQKVKYKLTISFEWVNNSAIEENIVKVTEIKLWRFDPTLSPVKYCPHCMDDREDAEIVSGKCATCNNEVIERQVGDYNTMADLIVKLDTNSQVVSIKTDDENTQDLYTYLSVLSHISFSGGMTLFDISDYGTDAGGSNVLTMRDGTAFNRRDVNMLRFNFTDLLSSVYVTCKFSVQTYDLKVHHLFDENGDTFIQSTTDRASYTSQYTEILKDEHYESKDSLESSNVWTDTTPTGKNQALATIPINLNLASAAEKYNIPYGYFLYGSYYDSALVGYRPMDDYYGVGANNGLNYKGDLAHKTTITYLKADGVTPIVEEVSFDGFNFIYSEGNYTKGRGGTGLDLDGDGGDGYIDQGSPLLGSTVNFPTKSIRYNKSFYLFKGWYEISGTNGGYITFDAYNDIDEASYINRNIVLYGYYYSNNTPTNIQFYTWNNDWNENSPAYLPYTNNANEYTLSSSDEMSPFIVDSGYLAPSANAVNYVDDEGRLILKSNVEYGVDSSRFSLDEFTGYELSNSNPSDLNLLNNILKTYWYYEETYTVLYAKNVDGEETAYIKYDPEVWSEYEYIQLPNNVDGMIVNTEQYEQFIKDGVTSFERLAMTSIEGDSGTATLESGGTVEILYDSTFAKYYFINPADGRYYFFNKDVKNTVMTKRILKKKAFYYEYGANQIREVKVNSSDDMGNTKLYIFNDSTGEFDIEKPLTQEVIFTYGNRFAGAELYAMVGVGSSAKYYKYHKVPESVIENAAENSFIDIYEPRYYVDIDGVRYYTMIHKNRDKGTHNDDKKFVDLFTEDGVKASSITYNITTLNNYYVLLDDIYYKINYYEYVDAHGSIYVNPMQSESTVTLPYGNSTKTYYFDYENNSNTSGLFEKYNAGEYSDAVLYEYRIYTPISKNYTLNAVLKNNVWISSDITLNAFPSLNMDYWYSNPDYVLLGYINVSNIDIEIIKRNENEGAVFENSQFSYIPALNQLVNTDEYLANQNPGSYTVFGTVDWFNNRLTEADSGNIYSIYHDDDIDKYYFLYPAEDGSMVYYYFANNETNVVQIMHEQGGQLFNAYADYIDNKYSGGAYADLRSRLKEAVAGKAREFGLSDLLRAPLFVDSYQLSSIDHKTIERVIMRISSQFVFTWEEICAAGLETFCSTVPGLAVSNGDGTYKITISSTFKYAFSLVTTKTQITTNIYAIPVFVPDVIRFTETDAFSTGAVSISGNTVKIDYSKMNVSHYDILNQMLYQSDYVWDLPELPAGATPENVEERNQLLKAADWLQFVMIDSDQFEEMSESIIGCDVKLDTMITEHGLDVISQETLTKDNQVLSFDMTGLTGEYYVFAFYYPIGTAANPNKHIHRVSDNYVKITVDAGTIIDFEIVENTMAKS